MIRQLPAGFALLIRGGCAPVIARLPRAWKDPDYRRARRRGQAAAQLTAETVARARPPRLVPAECPPGAAPPAAPGAGRTTTYVAAIVDQRAAGPSSAPA